MLFTTLGDKKNPAILFFHAMGVVGESSEPVANYLQDRYYCIMPTSTVYCPQQKYISKDDEIRQIEKFLKSQNIKEIAMVVGSSLGADLALYFATNTAIKIHHIFFDGGQFAQINKFTRKMMTPFLYLAIKSLYWSKGKTLSKIMWCDNDKIKPYFIEAGKNLTYSNMSHQMNDSLEDKPFPKLSAEMQKATFWEFGSIEEHYKYRDALLKSYPQGNFPVFKGYNHMQYQIQDPKGFAEMLENFIKTGKMKELAFVK